MTNMKQLNEFAQSRGYRDWIEFKAYEEPETVREARKMFERGFYWINQMKMAVTDIWSLAV